MLQNMEIISTQNIRGEKNTNHKNNLENFAVDLQLTHETACHFSGPRNRVGNIHAGPICEETIENSF